LVAVIKDLRLFIRITRSQAIIRRYFVVNGFDGALTMLGLTIGFRVGGEAELPVMISACVGAAVALGVSGVTSAYISESAERQKALRDLEQAMAANLNHTAHGMAARLVPLLIAMVNGLAPLVISLIIITPLWLVQSEVDLPWSALDTAIGLGFVIIFFLGTFLGRVSGEFWLWSGIRTVCIALVTAAIIMIVIH
jgi:predicted membrane protein (TIGR00267 family)